MKTVHARKVEIGVIVITLPPAPVRIRFVGMGRKKFMSNKRKPGRAAQKREALRE